MPLMGRRLILELEADLPPSGLVIAADGSSIRFAGWTELAQALTSAADSAGGGADTDPPAGPTAPG
jgi:hypothetical protein